MPISIALQRISALLRALGRSRYLVLRSAGIRRPTAAASAKELVVRLHGSAAAVQSLGVMDGVPVPPGRTPVLTTLVLD